MPVTEIALLSIKHPQSSTDTNPKSPTIPAEVQELLHHAISEQASFSGYPVTLLQCQDEPSLIFLLGGWESVSHHMDDWISGPINQELMKSLGEHVDVKWMFHLDVAPEEVLDVVCGRPERGESGRATVGRYVVRDGQRVACEVELRSISEGGQFGGLTRAISYGWRLDVGFVGDEDGGYGEVAMKRAENTVVVFSAAAAAAGGHDKENSQASVSEGLEGFCVERDVRPVRVMNFGYQ